MTIIVLTNKMDQGVCRALAVKSGGLGPGYFWPLQVFLWQKPCLVSCVDPSAGIESPYDIYERSKLVLT